ncbi:MAG: ABC transporter permease [Acidobacteriia bacterium]|nr:ABC transporter permease [Terriglobia bacterium]
MIALLRRLLAAVRRNKAERDLDDELRFHLQSLADEFEAKGLNANAARQAARRAFGGVEQTKEVYRDRRGLPLVDGALRDLRHTARSLLRSPGFTMIVVATIALAIGANAAVFLLLDQVVLRPLPVAQPSELVIVSAPSLPVETGRGMLSRTGRRSDGQMSHGVSYPLYQTLRKRIPLFQDVLAHREFRPTLLAGTAPVVADAELVTGNYFDMLGIKSAIGRTLRPDDDHIPVGNSVVVLTHGFWQRQFGSDPSVLNRTIRVNNCPLTIVGVAAPGFSGTSGGRGPDLFVPLTMSNQVAPLRGHDVLAEEVSSLSVLARLAPGVSRDQAEKYLRGVYETLFDEAAGRITKTFDATSYKARFKEFLQVSLFPGGYASSAQSAVTRELTLTLELLMTMVALVLLIAAGNVTNLLVARGAARARDMAIRLAIGAGRWRLLRERLIESLVLALVAGITSLFVTVWVVRLLPLVLPFGDRAAGLSLTLDRRVVVFSFLVAVATGLFLWLTSALQVTRRSSLPLLYAGATRQAGAGKPLRLRRGLVVVQVALSLGLLCASALLARSLYNLVTVDPGFKVEGLSAFSVQLPDAAGTAERKTLFLRQLLENVRGLPGVQAASLASDLPFTGGGGGSWASTPGVEKRISYDEIDVGPDYFRTIGMPLVAGRDFSGQDVSGAEKVAVINEALASALFGDGKAIERFVSFEEGMPADTRIVGIAKDAKAGPRAAARPTIYLPCFQRPGPATMNIVARMTGRETLSAGTVRSVLKRLDASVASSEPRAMADYIAESLLRERMLATLSVFFAVLAIVLTGIGLFGLTSFGVARRSHEIGVRLALGAARRSIVWLVVREVAVLTLVGGALGLAAYVAASRAIGAFLFGLSATDPPTVAAATIVLAAIALSAGFVPAWRAVHLDPAITLREE